MQIPGRLPQHIPTIEDLSKSILRNLLSDRFVLAEQRRQTYEPLPLLAVEPIEPADVIGPSRCHPFRHARLGDITGRLIHHLIDASACPTVPNDLRKFGTLATRRLTNRPTIRTISSGRPSTEVPISVGALLDHLGPF